MNTEFNYYEFLKKKEFLYDVKVDLSGLNLQSDGVSSEVDPNTGEISEINLNEVVDEEINYVYYPESTSVTYTSSDFDVNGVEEEVTEIRFQGQDVIETEKIDFDESDTPRKITLGEDNVEIPIFPRHGYMKDSLFDSDNPLLSVANVELNEALSSTRFGDTRVLAINSSTEIGFYNIPFNNEDQYQDKMNDTGNIGVDRIYITITGADDERLNGEFEVSSIPFDDHKIFNVRIPRYRQFIETPTGNLGSITKVRINYGGYQKRDLLVDRDVYAALGLWGTNNYNTRNNLGISDNKSIGYIGKKSFYSALQSLRERVNPLGIEVITNEYRKNIRGIDNDGDGEDDNFVDLNKSYLPSKRGFKFSRSIRSSRDFIYAKNLDDELLEFPSDEITPFTMSVKDVFSAQFTSASELESEFQTTIFEIINAIQDNPIIASVVDIGTLVQGDSVNPEFPIVTKSIEYTYSEAVQLSTSLGTVYDGDSDRLLATIPFARLENGQVSTQLTLNRSDFDPNDYTYLFYEVYWDKNILDGSGGWRILYRDGDVTSASKRIFKRETIVNENISVNALIDSMEDIEESVGEAQAASGLIATVTPSAGALLSVSIQTIIRRFNDFNTTISRIRWYQKYTNQSVFESGEMIYDDNKRYGSSLVDSNLGNFPVGPVSGRDGRIADVFFPYNKQMARILIPVDFGIKKEKLKTKNFFGFPYTTYRKIDMGVRWIEVRFLDTNTYTRYRKNNDPSGNRFELNTPFAQLSREDLLVTGTLSEPLTNEIMNRNPSSVTLNISDVPDDTFNGTFSGKVIDENTIEYEISGDPQIESSEIGTLVNMVVPFAPTQENEDPRNIRVTFNMPHLPFDDELRDKIFDDFGPFDQSEFANKSRGGDYEVIDGNVVENNDIAGWEIFQSSSKSVSDMRGGIDIYNKVQFLIRILEDEFGSSRVNLIETTRSVDDQEHLQLGGPASTFLSWHNYGLAAKIVITQEDNITPIKDGSDDLYRLLDIAEAFVVGVRNGDYGTPMNVVWCGQLVTGPDLFVWEFLPIGVEHKDALKFRDSSLQQKDAIVDNSFVNVTANGYVLKSGDEVPDNTPYIRDGSKGIREGININDEIWVHPKYIKNYSIPSDLILKDLQEFLTLIQVKMNSNGTELIGRKKINEWKVKNPKSFIQLVLFYGITGALSTTRSLLSGDYIEKFQVLVNTLSEKDPVKFVQRYLGDEYDNIKVYIEDLTDSSYISLRDGTLVTPVLEARSKQPEGSGNTFGQKQIDFTSVEFGQFQNGVFIPEGDDRIIEIKTDGPVIDGYIDGQAIEGDAVLLHSLIANQLIDEFDTIKDAFNNLSIKFMHDKFFDGSNESLSDLLENEFGVIKTQDLLTFDELRDMYKRIDINNAKSEGDGTVRGAGANLEAQNEDGVDRNTTQSVFEKLVSNSQLSGVRRASLTREKPVIEELANDVKVEDVIEEIQNRRIPKVRDIL